MVYPLWTPVWHYLLKLNRHVPYDAVILLLGVHVREMSAYVHEKTCSECCKKAQNKTAKHGPSLVE